MQLCPGYTSSRSFPENQDRGQTTKDIPFDSFENTDESRIMERKHFERRIVVIFWGEQDFFRIPESRNNDDVMLTIQMTIVSGSNKIRYTLLNTIHKLILCAHSMVVNTRQSN